MHENKEICENDSFKTWWNKGVNMRARVKDLVGNELPETSMAPLWSPVEPFVGVDNGKWMNTGRMLKSIKKGILINVTSWNALERDPEKVAIELELRNYELAE